MCDHCPSNLIRLALCGIVLVVQPASNVEQGTLARGHPQIAGTWVGIRGVQHWHYVTWPHGS
jgi:hypothetical protein